ncbi:MAG TPA: hypothetical protein VFX84_03305 [Candidatus Saccharimonadales bacterium]|nr:hypothetical protein [Candidatus Saccharimonadales bacterium]
MSKEAHMAPAQRLTDSEVRGAVRYSLQRSRERRSETPEPSRLRQARNWALAMGGAALLALGVGRGGQAAAEFVYDAFHDDDLQGQLTHPIGEVADDIRAGNIDAGEVTKFKVGDTEYAWSVASELTHDDHQRDTRDVASIIQAQQGNPVRDGSYVIVPTDSIDQPVEPQP